MRQLERLVVVLQPVISLAQITPFQPLLVLRHGVISLQLNLLWKTHYTPVIKACSQMGIPTQSTVQQPSQVMVKSFL